MENIVLKNQNNISNFENPSQKSFELGRIDVKNLRIPLENRWKSARNRIKQRPGERFFKNLLSGGGVITSLLSTYINAPARIQVICYAGTIAYMLLVSPVGLFSRLLSKISRFLLSSLNVLMIICILTRNNNLWVVWIICLTISCILIFFLNDFWIKTENWSMSEEIHHAMYGDDENRANKNWTANGKRSTRTLLYSMGVTVTDSDLDTIFKAIYTLGYWCSQKSIKENEHMVIKDLQEQLNEQTEEFENFRKEHLDTESNNSAIEYLYQGCCEANERFQNRILELESERDDLARDYNKLVDDYKELSKKVNIQEQQECIEVPLNLPKGVTREQYIKVCEMLDNGANDNHIKNVTGVSVYYIGKIKEIRKG